MGELGRERVKSQSDGKSPTGWDRRTAPAPVPPAPLLEWDGNSMDDIYQLLPLALAPHSLEVTQGRQGTATSPPAGLEPRLIQQEGGCCGQPCPGCLSGTVPRTPGDIRWIWAGWQQQSPVTPTSRTGPQLGKTLWHQQDPAPLSMQAATSHPAQHPRGAQHPQGPTLTHRVRTAVTPPAEAQPLRADQSLGTPGKY